VEEDEPAQPLEVVGVGVGQPHLLVGGERGVALALLLQGDMGRYWEILGDLGEI